MCCVVRVALWVLCAGAGCGRPVPSAASSHVWCWCCFRSGLRRQLGVSSHDLALQAVSFSLCGDQWSAARPGPGLAANGSEGVRGLGS